MSGEGCAVGRLAPQHADSGLRQTQRPESHPVVPTSLISSIACAIGTACCEDSAICYLWRPGGIGKLHAHHECEGQLSSNFFLFQSNVGQTSHQKRLPPFLQDQTSRRLSPTTPTTPREPCQSACFSQLQVGDWEFTLGALSSTRPLGLAGACRSRTRSRAAHRSLQFVSTASNAFAHRLAAVASARTSCLRFRSYYVRCRSACGHKHPDDQYAQPALSLVSSQSSTQSMRLSLQDLAACEPCASLHRTTICVVVFRCRQVPQGRLRIRALRRPSEAGCTPAGRARALKSWKNALRLSNDVS